MVKADFSSNFLDATNAQDNDIIFIVGKAEFEKKLSQSGQEYIKTNIPVEINGKNKIYSPSRETGIKFVLAWGDEMDLWVGKKATIKHVLKQVKGKTETYIEAYPIK